MDVSASKQAWRRAHLTRRASVPFDEDASCSAVLPLLGGVSRVAAYWALPGEPSTRLLFDAGVEVYLPRLLPSGDLELVLFTGDLEPGLRGTSAPVGPAVPWSVAELVVVPALSVDRAGVRLGRGGGSYDRALVAVSCPTVALLAFDDELVSALPAEPHDVPVTGIARPAGLWFVEAAAGP